MNKLTPTWQDKYRSSHLPGHQEHDHPQEGGQTQQPVQQPQPGRGQGQGQGQGRNSTNYHLL